MARINATFGVWTIFHLQKLTSNIIIQSKQLYVFDPKALYHMVIKVGDMIRPLYFDLVTS